MLRHIRTYRSVSFPTLGKEAFRHPERKLSDTRKGGFPITGKKYGYF
jgi:hypothetical protein